MSPGNLDFQIQRGITFGPYIFTHKDGSGVAVNLTGVTPFADVRCSPDAGAVEFSFSPVLTSGAGGIVTIPALTDEQTLALRCGNFTWDYVLETAGARHGPYLSGRVTVRDINTRD